MKRPRGYEVVCARNGKYAGRILHVDEGKRLSLQYHNLEDEGIHLFKELMELTIDVGGWIALDGLTGKKGEVDDRGRTIRGDRLMALLARDISEEGPGCRFDL